MKILVTGAAGFIGSNMCEFLLDKGHQVVGVDIFNDYYDPKIKEYNIKDFRDHEDFILYKDDITDSAAMESLFEKEKPEAIIHLAAWAGVTDSMKIPDKYVRNNEEGTVVLAELAVKYGVKSFVFASTSSVYGEGETVPYKEEMNTDHPLGPYPATKKGSEVMLGTYNENYGLNVTIYRIFNPIGIRLRPDLALPILIRSCLYDDVYFHQYWSEEEAAKIKRDYAYLGHILEAMEYAVLNPFDYEVMNLGNSSPKSLLDIREAVEKVVGKPPKIKIEPRRGGEMLVTYADVSKARELVGYDPVTTLEEMVRKYYEWFVEQEEWYKRNEV